MSKFEVDRPENDKIEIEADQATVQEGTLTFLQRAAELAPGSRHSVAAFAPGHWKSYREIS